jgi:hypothetical protein
LAAERIMAGPRCRCSRPRFEVGACGDRRLERVEVHVQQVDAADAVRGHGLGVGRSVAHAQQAAMHQRVQRLDPAVHHLRETGELGHVLHRQA